jgi:hypothetical protein
MFQRWSPLFLAFVFAAACGSTDEPQYQGLQSKGLSTPQSNEENQKILGKIEKIRTAKPLAVKDEAPEAPLATKYFMLTDAYEETGFLPESLRHEVKLEDVAGKQSYVKVSYFDKKPEVATLYDAFDNSTNRIEYKWTPDFKIEAAEYQNRTGAMLKMFRFCHRGEGKVDIHEHNSFRVHKPYTGRATVEANRITVSFVDGHDLKGGLAIWADCKELDPATDAAKAYESPWGTSRMEFAFDEKGKLLEFARFNTAGALDSDYRGIAKRKMTWNEEGRLLDEVVYDGDVIFSNTKYIWEEGVMKGRKILSATGAPKADYLGVASYEFEYDKKGRKIVEKRFDEAGALASSATFEYNRKGALVLQKELDAAGAVLRSYEHKYDKKGLRTEYNIFAGTVEEARPMLDENRVAAYRWTYNKDGFLTEQSFLGLEFTTAADGTRSPALTNNLDDVAKIVYNMDDKSNLVDIRKITVDAKGNAIKESITVEGAVKEIITRSFGPDNVMVAGTKTVMDAEGRVGEVQTLDAQEKPLTIAKNTWDVDGLLERTEVFAADGTTKAADAQGVHRKVYAYDLDNGGRILPEAWTDLNDSVLLSVNYEYDPEGKPTKATKSGPLAR